MNWTQEQKSAIDSPIKNLLLAAAAGSGKTQTLTGRVLDGICNHGKHITDYLIVTFTRAAAAEMKERIFSEISKQIRKNPTNHHLLRQPSLLPAANITTMDSFCLDLVKQNFYSVGLDPGFSLCSKAELEVMKQDAMEACLEKLYQKSDPYLLNIIEAYGGRFDDGNLEKFIINFAEFLESLPFPRIFINNAITQPSPEQFAASPSVTLLMNFAKTKITYAVAYMKCALQLSTADERLDRLSALLADELHQMQLALRIPDANENYDILRDTILGIKFLRRPTIRGVDCKLIDDFRKNAKSIFSALGDIMAYPLSTAYIVSQNQRRNLEALITILDEYQTQLSLIKKEKNLMYFSDITRLTLDLLVKTEDGINVEHTPLAKETGRNFAEIYIDEYQDTNDIGDLIFNSVSGLHEGRPNLFMVGDIKQSIYRFRKTNPALFGDKLEQYKDHGDFQKIFLSKNFRSRRQVIDSVNQIFSTIMTSRLGEVNYDAQQRLYSGADYPESNQCDTEVTLIEGDGLEREADWVAMRIEQLMKEMTVTQKGITRPIAYSDIVILLRSAKRRAEVFRKALANRGIVAHYDSTSGFFDSPEIATFLSLLTIIDNPRNDIPLIAALRSPIFSFTEKQLYEIRRDWSGDCYYDALLNNSAPHCKEFLAKLSEYRDQARKVSASQLIWYLLMDTGYYDMAGAMDGGAQKQANLRLLCDKARQYEKNGFLGLYNFVRYIENVTSVDSDTGGATLASEAHDVVRIMSIHKSKGLEFPVVFLCSCASHINMEECRKDMLLHGQLGAALLVKDITRGIKYRGLEYYAISEKMKEEKRSEELRVLYVALTRAKEKLVITGTTSDIDRQMKNWSMARQLPDVNPAEEFSCFMDWIGVCIDPDGGGHLRLSLLRKPPGELEQPEEQEVVPLEFLAPCLTPEQISPEIRSVLEYQYPEDINLPAKISVSEITQQQTIVRPPTFERIQKNRRMGNAIHLVMQTIDPMTTTQEQILHHIQLLTEKGALKSEDALLVPVHKILAFFHSHIGQMLRKADQIFREQPFTCLADGGLIMPEAAGKTFVLQGTIDLYFICDNTIVLVDYKSGHRLEPAFEKQLELYEIALSKKYFGKDFKKYIYLFNKNDIIEL